MDFQQFLSQLGIGGAPTGAGRFAEPDLMPQQAAPKPWSPSDAVAEAPLTVMLRNLLGSSSGGPPNNPDPEGAALAKSISQASPPGPSPAPGIAVGSMPQPSDPSKLAMFAQGGQQPTGGAMPPRPSAAPQQAVPPFQTSVKPAEPQGGGIMDMLAGLQKNPTANLIRDLLGSAMAGAATATGPRAGNVGAFGVGYTTADQQMRAREKEKSAAEFANKKLGFDQTMAVRKDTREERGAGREDEKLKLSRVEQERKNEETKVKNKVAVDKLMQARAGTLSLDAKFKLQDQVTRYLDKLNKNGLMEAPALEAAGAKKLAELEAYYGVQKQGATAPAAGGSPVTATGPNGQKLILQGGQWVPAP